jgi:hypothetical protein
VRPKWGWQRCGCVVVSVCLVSSVGLFAGCEKVGDGGQKAQEAPPSTTPPSTTPPTSPPPVSPVASITLVAGATSLLADGVSSTTITAQLVTSTNTPAPDGTEVNFSTNLGRFNTNGAKFITAAVSQGSGTATVPFISEAGVGGTATVVAQVQSLTRSLQITLTLPAPPPVGLMLEADATVLKADGASSTTIRATVLTSTGAPAPDGTVVTFTTDLGRFSTEGDKSMSAATTQGTGEAAVPFISEAGKGGTATVVATVGNLSQSLQIIFELPTSPPPSPPSPPEKVVRINLTADPAASLLANGSSSTTIRAFLETSSGVRAPDGTVVTFTTDLGRFATTGLKSLRAVTKEATGEAVVPLISEPNVIGTATVVATVEGLTQSIQISFVLTTPPTPPPTDIAGLTLSAANDSLAANGISSTTIAAVLITSTGASVPDGVLVTFTTDLGRFTSGGAKSTTARTGGGRALVPFISEEDVVGTATIVASAGAVTQSIEVELLPVTPIPPSQGTIVGIKLTAESNSLVANGTSSTVITAELITATGSPAPDGVTVNFITDKGRFSTDDAKTATATTEGGTGSVAVPFISEAGVFGTATIVASVGAVTQSIEVELIPPYPIPPSPGTIVGIRLSAESNSLVANGTSSTIITAELVTFTGNPAPDGVTVNFITDKGRFSTDNAKTIAATTTDSTGKVLVPFISEAGVVGTATVVATVSTIAQSIQIALTGAGDPAQIILLADATVIPISGTTVITAEVLDDQGNNVTDGTAVNFATNLSGTGVTPVATTTDGVATATFSAGTSAGVATVTATSGSASSSLSITIQAGVAGSLEFVSADPILIGVRGSALPQKSTITFRARDVNGNPVADGTQVTFTLISGLGGGEAVAPTTVGTIGGLASTILTSGTVSGPVRVLASITIGTTTLTSSSTNVSIAGGPPSGAHIGVAPAFRNIAGLVTQGIICPVTAIVGDRFGNPVPQNTTVSFFTNGGVVTPQGLTDALGNTPGVDIKTGPPTPHVGTATNFGDPRTGLVTVIAVTQGEETFIDSNGNGLFDGPGEFDPADPEIDTPEPFIDHVNLCNGVPAPCLADPVNPPLLSGNGSFDPNDRYELFIDGNGNGAWDPPNVMWDAHKPIFASTTVLFTGPTRLTVGVLQPNGSCSGNPTGFNVPDGGSSPVLCFLASDPAGRPLVGGTQIRVTTSSGAISGTSSVDLPDTQRGGPGITFFTFAVVDTDPGDTDPPSDAVVTVSVTSPSSATCPGGNGDLAVSFSGSVN